MQKKTILIIDDDQELRETLGSALLTAGFEVLHAKDAMGGVALALQRKPDLILLDIMMPNVNGHKALYELRKDDWGKTAKIIMLSALDDAAAISQDVELKADDYIIKSSMSLQEIITKVKHHLVGYTD